MQTFAVPMQMRLCQVYKRSHGGNEVGVSSKKACCVGRHVQQDCLSQLKRLTLLKSTFKLESYISPTEPVYRFIMYLINIP